MAVAKKKKPTEREPRRRTLSPWYTLALFGSSGAGKTTLAATAPKPYFLDSNQGLLAIDGRPGFEHVRGDPCLSLDRIDKVYSYLTGTGSRNWRGKYKTVVFDHFDDIQAIVLDHLGDKAVERDPRRLDDPLSQREWGIMGNRLRRILRQYKRLPMHKIMIFSAGMDKTTEQLIPRLQGSLREDLPYYCDFIGYLRVGKNGTRYLHLEQTEQFLAKCRLWWWTERKIKIDFDDPRTLTKFFERVAAGAPKNSTIAAAK